MRNNQKSELVVICYNNSILTEMERYIDIGETDAENVKEFF